MKQVITMHGWCGDSNTWERWQDYFEAIGCLWQNGDRGYFNSSSLMPNWHEKASQFNSFDHRILFCHSLGIHLISNKILESASHVILICSFSQFLSNEEDNRSLEVALKGMKKALGTYKEQFMIQKFLKKANEPYSDSLNLNGTFQKQLSQSGRLRLIKDLDILINTKSLPKSLFLGKAKVLVINAAQDAIILPLTRNKLINDLKENMKEHPICWNIENAGHSLSHLDLAPQVETWISANS